MLKNRTIAIVENQRGQKYKQLLPPNQSGFHLCIHTIYCIKFFCFETLNWHFLTNLYFRFSNFFVHIDQSYGGSLIFFVCQFPLFSQWLFGAFFLRESVQKSQAKMSRALNSVNRGRWFANRSVTSGKCFARLYATWYSFWNRMLGICLMYVWCHRPHLCRRPSARLLHEFDPRTDFPACLTCRGPPSGAQRQKVAGHSRLFPPIRFHSQVYP